VQAAEALILARYFMFTQVYFHKTRVAYDHHLRHTLGELLPDGQFPPPTPDRLKEYLDWDDWRVLGMLAERKGGEHGQRLIQRAHYREIYHTPESPGPKDLVELANVKQGLGALVQAEESAGKSWYRVDRTDIPIISDTAGRRVRSLSLYSSVVAGMEPTNRVMLYARPEEADIARSRVREVIGERT
jgi:HD superfamily phosphohydrolase